ncbi:Fur family transcriptional regulator [Kaarinaea lacus]
MGSSGMESYRMESYGMDRYGMETIGQVDALLRKYGISPTQQRRKIARLLFAKPQHLSADQILAQVNQQKTVASKATVYNTLGLFARKGLINEVIVDPSKVFYDSNTRPHYHFYNTETGELTDFDMDQLSLANLPELPEGTGLQKVDIIIHVKPEK